METIWDSHLNEKLRILADAAKYDAACTSSGVDRKNGSMGTGNAVACGICHSFSADGRCISLLKILLTNDCCYDCVYCVNRVGNDTERATFSPDEVCTLTMGFYRRNYIEGLFLSSAVYRNPSYTMELIYETVLRLRTVYHFHGYIHVKAIPGADPQLIQQTGFLVDRMSCNLELPTAEGLRSLAPNKPRRQLLKPMRQIQQQITVSKHEVALYRHAQPFVPAGQSTQMIIGATGESDYQIMSVSEALYGRFKMKRVFYSAYVGVNEDSRLPAVGTYGGLRFEDLKKMGVVLKRAMYFITCQGRVYMPFRMDERFITTNLLGLKERLPENVVRSGDTFRQLNLFNDFHLQMPVEQEDKRQVLTGQL